MKGIRASVLAFSLLALAACSSWQPMCPDYGYQYRICYDRKIAEAPADTAARPAAIEKERPRLADELAAAQRQDAMLSSRVNDLERQLADRDRELASLRSGAGDSARLASQLSSAQGDLGQAKARIAELERMQADRDREGNTELARLRLIDKEHDREHPELERLRQQTATQNKELARLRPIAAEHEKEGNLAGDLDAARKRVMDLEKQLADRDKELAELRGDLSEQMKKLTAAQRGLVRTLRPEINKGHIAVDLNNDRLLIKLASTYLFGLGENQLKSGGADALKRVGSILNDYPEYNVEVAGHTDNLPITSALKSRFPSNKELSEARAASAVEALASGGLAESAMKASGYADTKPVASNATKEGRAKNRRIEVIVTAKQ